MAESVAALGLAVNILSVINFGKDFVKLARDIYHRGADAFNSLGSLRLISKDLKIITQQVQRKHTVADMLQEESDQNIFKLADQCSKVAQRMLDTIEKLGIPDENNEMWQPLSARERLVAKLPKSAARYSKRDAIMMAFKTVWNEREINSLQSKLDQLGNQMTRNLAVSFRFYITKSVSNQERILKDLAKDILRLQSDSSEVKGRLDQIAELGQGMGSALIEYLVFGAGPAGPAHSVFRASLRQGLLAAIYDNPRSDIQFKVPAERKLELQNKFISRLSYEEMNERELRVAGAHETTFRWIFEDPDSQESQSRAWDNFCRWLESDQRLYWVTGKAGSGKSTLMKFVSQPGSAPTGDIPATDQNRRCGVYLDRWAGGAPLLVATFYFWVGGSKMQTSKEGLYRTLLYQILNASPDAIAEIAPERWEGLCLYNEDARRFTEAELQQLLSKAIAVVGRTTKICLFIDGLDEFAGDYRSLIDWVQITIKMPSVKVCVASRPWIDFENALKDKPNLLLEELTYDDIKQYVTSRFTTDENFAFLEEGEPEFSGRLIEEVVRKASGVFLWVELVCTSLLNGMTAGDRVSDLQQRLDDIPEDLERLYDRILDNLDRRYIQHAAELFYLMLACPKPPEALLFSYADEENTGNSIEMATEQLPEEKRRHRIETMRKRLNSRCRGLLVIPRLPRNGRQVPVRTVQYMHRTVKDYIEQESVQDMLCGMIQDTFDPHIRLCAAALSIWKVDACHAPPPDSNNNQFETEEDGTIMQCMHHASRVSVENQHEMTRIMDGLLASIPSGRQLIPSLPISPISDSTTTHLSRKPTCFGRTFLSLAVKRDVVEYVQRKAEPGCLVRPNTVPLALWNLEPPKFPQPGKVSWKIRVRKFIADIQTSDTPVPAMAPISTSQGISPWPLLLDALFSRSNPNPRMVEVLLRNGADPNLHIYRREIRTTIWIEALALAVALYAKGSVAELPDWEQALSLMIRYGAKIESKTIDQAFRLVTDAYEITLSNANITISSLQTLFRKFKFGSGMDEPLLRLKNAAGSWRTGNLTYNPHNNVHIKRQARRAAR